MAHINELTRAKSMLDKITSLKLTTIDKTENEKCVSLLVFVEPVRFFSYIENYRAAWK